MVCVRGFTRDSVGCFIAHRGRYLKEQTLKFYVISKKKTGIVIFFFNVTEPIRVRLCDDYAFSFLVT